MGSEHFAFQNLGRPDKYWVDVMGEYPGVTRVFEISGFGNFPGYVINDYEEIFLDPGRPRTDEYIANAHKRFRSGLYQYRVMGLEHSLYDERFVPDGHHENLDIVNIPSKSMGFHCSRIGKLNRAPLGHVHMIGAHMGGDNFSFIDGHAHTYKVKPIKEYWRATGGDKYRPTCGTGANGLYSYAYPPEVNAESSVAGAEWWTVPYYPSDSLYDVHPTRPVPVSEEAGKRTGKEPFGKSRLTY